MTDSNKTSHVFGPVPSRRLGRSLGLDLVPFKTCSYDCLYCQLGVTTRKTMERRTWVPVNAVLDELRLKLDSNPDYITLSGSGEPTLHADVDKIIHGVKEMTDTPVAVLTNGSLLWMEDVQAQLMDADLVVPSLDAGDESMFEAVNRPCAGISFQRMVEGLGTFREQFSGTYWLEVVILGGYTSIEPEARKIARYVKEIKPDRVQLNTVTRPPAEDYAHRVDGGKLAELAGLFEPRADVVADFREIHEAPEFTASENSVMSMLERRPCSIQDIADGLGIHQNEAVKYIEELAAQGKIEAKISGGKRYFTKKITI